MVHVMTVQPNSGSMLPGLALQYCLSASVLMSILSGCSLFGAVY
jgi:hypothetical protein